MEIRRRKSGQFSEHPCNPPLEIIIEWQIRLTACLTATEKNNRKNVSCSHFFVRHQHVPDEICCREPRHYQARRRNWGRCPAPPRSSGWTEQHNCSSRRRGFHLQGLATNSIFFSFLFVKNQGFAWRANQWPLVRETLFSSVSPSYTLDLPRGLLPELQRYKGVLR